MVTSRPSSSGSSDRNRNREVPYTVPPDLQESIRALDGRIKRIEEQNFTIDQSLESIKDLLDKHLQNAFQIKGSVYEEVHNLHIQLIIEVINFAILPQRHN